MDNTLLITWIFIVITGLSIDVLAYMVLRVEWKKSGVILTDKLWNRATEKLGGTLKTGRERLLPTKLQPNETSELAQPEPNPSLSEAPAVEIIPVSVKDVGGLRRVQFSLDMAMNTTINVRIGATSEAGVKVEKQEI